jgi:hypothetical protein
MQGGEITFTPVKAIPPDWLVKRIIRLYRNDFVFVKLWPC